MMLKNRIQEAPDSDDGYAVFKLCHELAETWPKNQQIPPARYAEWLNRIEQDTQPLHQNPPAPAPVAEISAPAAPETDEAPVAQAA
jgi:hypothetical protein